MGKGVQSCVEYLLDVRLIQVRFEEKGVVSFFRVNHLVGAWYPGCLKGIEYFLLLFWIEAAVRIDAKDEVGLMLA
jgi:hypothetical protein